MSRLVAIALNSAERSYLLRLLQHELEEHDEPLIADLLKMLEDAVPPGFVASLSRELRV
jgi:hypothetical protein